MIDLQDVSKVYRSRRGEVRAVDGVSLRIDRGQYVALRGPSGCGKSTLLSLVGGLALPSSGKIVVAEQELSGLSPRERAAFRRRHVGFVFQMFHLLPYLTVRENILLGADSAEQQAQADTLMQQFALAERALHVPRQLSAGERQRTALARALLHQPDILLADEPTGNLDPDNANLVLDAISAFHQAGGTVVLVTHEEAAAARAERHLAMQRGQLAT